MTHTGEDLVLAGTSTLEKEAGVAFLEVIASEGAIYRNVLIVQYEIL